MLTIMEGVLSNIRQEVEQAQKSTKLLRISGQNKQERVFNEADKGGDRWLYRN